MANVSVNKSCVIAHKLPICCHTVSESKLTELKLNSNYFVTFRCETTGRFETAK